MMAVVDLDTARAAREDAAFERYRLAWLRVQETGAIEDAREAGRAWRAYLDIHMSPQQRAEFARIDAALKENTRRTGSIFGGHGATPQGFPA